MTVNLKEPRTTMEPELYKIRHSLAHVLAQAVLTIRPEATLGFGPPTTNGFFYDFSLEQPLTNDDFPKIEAQMKHIIKANQPFVRSDYPANVLIDELKKTGKVYKAEMAEGFVEEGETTLSVYRSGDFSDMCEGPHVPSTADLPMDAFCLDSLAGAYWRGDEKNPMLQRVYALAFNTKAELDQFLKQRELARERDHRKLGAQMQLFALNEEVGKGLPLWLPNGAAIRDALEDLAREVEFRAGYQRVSTPHITRSGLYYQSGHLPHYAEGMFPAIEADGESFYLKPMNCPHHHMIFKAAPRSYRDLPLRLSEYGMCYRYEQSGELSGLLRVRAMSINDAHIYCRPEQTTAEFVAVMQMHLDYYRLFDISDFWMRLSLPDLSNSDKYVGDAQMWEDAEKLVVEAMETLNIDYVAERGEAAFYGPKIDMQIKNVVGREETASTNQLDLVMSERFDLSYVGADNKKHRPHIIHRAPLGSHERFIAFLIEHYGGVFPTWLAPVQVRILPLNDSVVEAAFQLQQTLRNKLVRVEVDDSNETLGKKIRMAQEANIPNLFLLGPREVADQSLSWRRHGSKAQQTINTEQAIQVLLEEIAQRKDWRKEQA